MRMKRQRQAGRRRMSPAAASLRTGRRRGRIPAAAGVVRKKRAARRSLRAPKRSASGAPGLPGRLRAAAVVSVRNEERTVGEVVRELTLLPLQEIVVVINGSSDGSYHAVCEWPSVTVVHYPEPLGHDVGRAVGARMTDADILLFVDGDFPIAAHKLAPYLAAVHRGADVALNDITPFFGPFRQWDDVSRVKAFLNRSLGRPELSAASMTAVPHAISRRALEAIGAPALMIPPKAQAAAIGRGLRVVLAPGVNVTRRNKPRDTNAGQDNPVARLIIGDHYEALREAMLAGGARLDMADAARRRDLLRGGAS